MNKTEFESKTKLDKHQDGTATVIAALIMALLIGFVTLAISRTTNETMAMANDISETKAYAAAQASLENMTMQADDRFEARLDLTPTDTTDIQSNYPSGFGNYQFTQTLAKVGANEVIDATDQKFQGLKQIRDTWQFTTTALDPTSGVQSILRRRFYNNRIPLFQFGIFYDDDLEFHPGARFDFGGRVHSNGNLFLKGADLHFNSRVTAAKEIVTDVMRNGTASSDGSGIKVINASNVEIPLYDSATSTQIGSARNSVVNGTNLSVLNPDSPPIYTAANWDTVKGRFDGNLVARIAQLKLPVKLSVATAGADLIEIVKRGKDIGDLYNNGTGTVLSPTIVPVTAASADPELLKKQRYYNASGIRVSLSDTQNRLPGCATATVCGVRLDGNATGGATSTSPRGYQPLPITIGTSPTVTSQATRLNGDRMYNAGKEMWIKIELVNNNPATGVVTTTDVTQDILSLGVTEEAVPIVGPDPTTGVAGFSFFNVPGSSRDSRSIIKLQRFTMPGSVIKAGSSYLRNYTWNSNIYNLVVSDDADATTTPIDSINPNLSSVTPTLDPTVHQVSASAYIGGLTKTINIAPFPIMMFDSREGLATAASVPTLPTRNGVMSMIDIDAGNLRKFLKGDFDGMLPTTTPYAISKLGISLKSTDIPQDRGWVFYVSDRRGDYDFDGEYDMEDVYGAVVAGTKPYGGNDGILQGGEDVNKSGVLEADYVNEAPLYSLTYQPDVAAVVNTPYYRRGVRLINGDIIPGKYDAAVPANTRGFAFATENGVYVEGNYNAVSAPSGTPTRSDFYLPSNTVDHIPASIAGDAMTILSNNWKDSNSFSSPYSTGSRVATETTLRFGMIAGDALSSLSGTPNQGVANEYRLGGGVHNFKRFLETWGGVKVNYAGSLINMYNSRNNNGTYKATGQVYGAPIRNWTFDTSFLDLNRLPPSTPFFQSLTLTGFERVNQ